MKEDVPIQEIREVRRRMTAEAGHDLDRFFALLKEEEKQFEPQIQRWREIERQYQQSSLPVVNEAEDAMVLRDRPKP